MSTLSRRTLVNRWKAWGKHENRRTTPSVPTQKRWYMLTLLMLLGAGVYAPTGWLMISHYTQQHPYFSISAIDVDLDVGALFSQEEIIAWSGITHGMNLWTVDPEQVRARLLTYQGIRDVEVRREFPQRVIVQVRTRHPSLLSPILINLSRQDGVWFKTQGQKENLICHM